MFIALENIIFGKRKECRFDTSTTSHMFILPGMLGPVNRVFSLVNYLQKQQSQYAITAIPLGLSTADFQKIVQTAQANINKNLLSKIKVEEIILFGHSHGGRIACALLESLSSTLPQVSLSVITAATPIVEKPKNLSWYRKIFYYLLSRAFRQWPQVNQPRVGNNSVKKYIGYYSGTDKVVNSESAKLGHRGNLYELEQFSHTDFIRDRKMGPILVSLLKKEFATGVK